MSDFGEAIGTAIEGSLYSKAVDKDGKAAAPLEKGHFAEGECLNCGTQLIGKHCHECGQKAHLHRTIGAFMHDLVHGALHFEGKIWKTLPKLLFKPGELTRRYIAGERARFVSPMALFLFVIFLMFAVFQMAGLSSPDDVGNFGGNDLKRAQEARGELESALAEREDLSPEERELAQQRLEGVTQAIESIQQGGNYRYTRLDGSSTYQEINLTGVEVIDKGIIAKWRKNPEMMLYKLQTNFYKFSWLLIPLSIPFVWLLFAWKRRFKAYDHAIFVTYSLSFMTLLILAATLAGLAGLHIAVIVLAMTFIPVVHIYKHLRGAYDIGRFSALWRLMVLTIFIMIVLTLFLQLLLLLGAF